MKRRSSISQIAKRMSASPPSMCGSALEPAKACNRRKKPEQITTSKPFDCGSLIASRFTRHDKGKQDSAAYVSEEHSKKDGSGMIANPSQAIPPLTSFTCIDDATVSVSESPAIKLEVSIIFGYYRFCFPLSVVQHIDFNFTSYDIHCFHCSHFPICLGRYQHTTRGRFEAETEEKSPA